MYISRAASFVRFDGVEKSSPVSVCEHGAARAPAWVSPDSERERLSTGNEGVVNQTSKNKQSQLRERGASKVSRHEISFELLKIERERTRNCREDVPGRLTGTFLTGRLKRSPAEYLNLINVRPGN